MLKRTPFYDFHLSAGAKMVDFAGWEMPLLYRGIVEEHQQTRQSGSMFDVSHMGRLHFSGKDAMAFLDRVLTRNIGKMLLGQSRYSLACNEAGGVLDDVIVSRDAKHYLVVCNASNRAKLVEHFSAVRKSAKEGGYDLDFSDQTESTAMVAIQGPRVIDRLGEILPGEVKELKRYSFTTVNLLLAKLTVFRSGYTGEDGVEIILPAKLAGMAMKMLAGKMDKADATIKPAGLGARDTLRLEAGMPLYGHELTESIDPLSADLGWAVDLSKEFIGADALRKIAEHKPKRKLVGLEFASRRIARQETPIVAGGGNGTPIGVVTSGTFSPTLQKSIAMAYVEADHSAVGTEVAADLKGALEPARIVPLPLYHRPK